MVKFDKIQAPAKGDKIEIKNGKLQISDHPIIPRIEGDGIGPDISQAAVRVWDASVELAYGGKRRIAWFEIFAGERAQQIYGQVLPGDTFKAIRAPLFSPGLWCSNI